ncbi:diphosphate--fructose-6-phosphate 1-phosphotransferase [Shouchella shacheensis]|uniref:diphosphate--fructose-6-phosphate 1-phosphotransferase n=1 Tax=Shouchella shacheensis TaxID=1649580 RepID=UPI0007405503|nr:diphosphate--fructose-6-phosphate 1-phosphotransferase [Shouchella shacheensis]
MRDGHCLIAQSGGPTAVINNSLYGIIEEAIYTKSIKSVFGAVYGIQGLLQNEYVPLHTLSKEKRNALRYAPGAALGTWRYKVRDQDISTMVSNMMENEIRYFFYIGGNGSMFVANCIYEESLRRGYDLTVIGVPKSIDNDVMHTDHCPGFGSAAKFLATSVVDMHMDVRSMANSNRITLLETMGRDTGWLAASCSLVKNVNQGLPTLVFIPEAAFSREHFLKKVKEAYDDNGYCIAVISEGIKDSSGHLLSENRAKGDSVGRPQLGGVSSYLSELIEKETNLKARYVVPSIWQRSSMGISSDTDTKEALGVGKHAVRQAVEGKNGIMTTLLRKNDRPYEVTYSSVPLRDVAGGEKAVPVEWYDYDRCDMREPFQSYGLPLIQGENSVPMQGGLPVYQTL